MSSTSKDGAQGRLRNAWLARLTEWRSGKSRERLIAAEPVYNLLVVSDLHLGEASKDRSRIEDLKATELEDREFCRFLQYQRSRRQNGRPWVLVLAGDTFDFPAVSLSPDPRAAQERYGFTVSPQERRRGLDNSEAKARWKLDRILDRHPGLLAHLADFVGSGNRLIVLVGNHDAELYWPGVQQALVQRLVDLYFGGEQTDGEQPDEFRARIEFRSWFYHHPGLAYIQHGHQFDAYCSLLNQLHPRRAGNQELMELSSTGILIRYGLSRVRGVRSHGKDDFTFRDYLRWLIGMPAAKSGQLTLAYLQVVWEQLRYLRSARRGNAWKMREKHLQAMAQESERQGLPLSTLAAIDMLHARPANLGYVSLLSSMFLDSILTVLLAPILTLLWCLFAPFRWRGKLLGSTTILGGAFLLLQLFGARRSTQLAPKLRNAARRIAPWLPVPYIVMGHSHTAELRPLPGGSVYANTGSWLLAASPDPAVDPSEHSPRSFLVLRPAGEGNATEAELLRWNPDTGEPETLAVDQRADARPPRPEAEQEPALADATIVQPSA